MEQISIPTMTSGYSSSTIIVIIMTILLFPMFPLGLVERGTIDQQHIVYRVEHTPQCFRSKPLQDFDCSVSFEVGRH